MRRYGVHETLSFPFLVPSPPNTPPLFLTSSGKKEATFLFVKIYFWGLLKTQLSPNIFTNATCSKQQGQIFISESLIFVEIWMEELTPVCKYNVTTKKTRWAVFKLQAYRGWCNINRGKDSLFGSPKGKTMESLLQTLHKLLGGPRIAKSTMA